MDGRYVVSVEERTKDKAHSISWTAYGWPQVLVRVRQAVEEAARREHQEKTRTAANDRPRYCGRCGSEEHYESEHC